MGKTKQTRLTNKLISDAFKKPSACLFLISPLIVSFIYFMHFVALDYLFQWVWNIVQFYSAFWIFCFFCGVLFWKTNRPSCLHGCSCFGILCCDEFLFMNKCFHLNCHLHGSSVCSLVSCFLFCGFSLFVWVMDMMMSLCLHHHHRHWSALSDVNCSF